MLFTWTPTLILLGLVPAVLLAYLLAQRRRQIYTVRYASLALVRDSIGREGRLRRHLPAALYLASLFVMLLALARPVAVMPAPAPEGTVILALDVSGSMGAADLYPNRMEAAKAAGREFVAREPSGIQIGVV